MGVIDDRDDRDSRLNEGDDYAALVRGLVHDLAGTSITRLELRHEDLHVVLRRVPGAVAPVAVVPNLQATGEYDRPDDWRAVAAPLTGIFYARPSPEEDLYVRVGGHVEPDSIVGLIETMKMFNEVTADVAGTVREIAAESGALVEAGQPILYVEPGESLEGPPAGA